MGTSDTNPTKKKSSDSKPQEDSLPSKETKLVTPPSPKAGRSPFLRRNGSLGKGPHKTTIPQGFKLATEARSLVRPCGCGKDGVFSPHTHGHGHTHHKKAPALPEVTNRGPKAPTPKSPQITRKVKDIVAVDGQPKSKVSSPKKCPPKSSALPVPTKSSVKPKEAPEVEGTSRFVSTVVWYPEMKPEFNSMILNLTPGEETYSLVDEILVKEYDSYLKRRLPASNMEIGELDGPLHVKKIEANNFGKIIEGCLASCDLKINPVSIS